MAEVSVRRVRGRPRSGWMDGVKVALGNRGMTVDAARQCAKDRKEWRSLVHLSQNEFHAVIFAWPCVLSDLPPVLWWLSPGEGGIALHHAVGINCKKGTTTENQGSDCQVHGLRDVVDDCVCVVRLDMTTPPWWREKGMVYYYYYN